MPRSRSEQPGYQYHTRGQAKVKLGPKVFYLGKHGTPESYARYYSLLAEYNANGKVPPSKDVEPEEPVHMSQEVILVKHISADFRARKLPFQEANAANHCKYKNLCQLLDDRHGDEPASEFGPLKLEALRDLMVSKGIGKNPKPNSRKYANAQIKKVIEIITHGVARQLIEPDRIVALQALAPLKRGQARENPKRTGVPVEVIRSTIPFLTTTSAAMVRLQLATAMRPSEIFRMTPAMIDRSGPVWFYRPDDHKTEHHGKTKAVPILGEALEALSPYLFGDADELCFMTTKGTPWDKDSYRIAVVRAARKAKVQHWTPYQIRHESLQAVRDAAGPEAAQAIAGHSRMDTTETYAKASEAKAIEGAMVAPTLREHADG